MDAVEWAHANSLAALPIYAAVGLSLGFDIEVLAPAGRAWRHRAHVEPPADYRPRIIAAESFARAGKLALTGTSTLRQSSGPSLQADSFDDAQCWEVDLVAFREFCDAQGWTVPDEFMPVGFVPKAGGASHEQARTPVEARKGALPALTPEQVEEVQRLFRAGHSQAELARRFGTSRRTISTHLIRAGLIVGRLRGDPPASRMK